MISYKSIALSYWVKLREHMRKYPEITSIKMSVFRKWNATVWVDEEKPQTIRYKFTSPRNGKVLAEGWFSA